MKRLMHILMLSCKKASALIIKRNDFMLTRTENMKLFFHLMMCNACRNFEKQNQFMNKALEKNSKPAKEQLQTTQVPEELKDRILSKISG